MKSSSHIIAIGAIALGLALPTLTTAQEPSATIVQYGRYTPAVLEEKPPAKDGGRVKDETPIETTTEIPAKIGELFGICVMFKDLPKNQGCTVRKVMSHPPFKENGVITTNSVDVMKFKAGLIPDRCVFFGWSFLKGYEYELVPGKWTCTIYIDDKEVASKTFEVKK